MAINQEIRGICELKDHPSIAFFQVYGGSTTDGEKIVIQLHEGSGGPLTELIKVLTSVAQAYGIYNAQEKMASKQKGPANSATFGFDSDNSFDEAKNELVITKGHFKLSLPTRSADSVRRVLGELARQMRGDGILREEDVSSIYKTFGIQPSLLRPLPTDLPRVRAGTNGDHAPGSL